MNVEFFFVAQQKNLITYSRKLPDMPSIGLVCNVYNDKIALQGLLESGALSYFDDAFILHAGPNNKRSTDGTIELIEQYGIRHGFMDILKGFDVVRTRLIHESRCEWSFIMDADERFYTTGTRYEVSGTEKYPDSKNPNLPCRAVETYDQGAMLREMLAKAEPGHMAVRLMRRHWMNAPGEEPRPAQNWHHTEDWQLRCIRNDTRIFFERKLHELLKWTPNWQEPPWISGDKERGPFHDHYNVFYKSTTAMKNTEDIQTYRAIDSGLVKGMWIESFPQS
jgi:hypothetical protein